MTTIDPDKKHHWFELARRALSHYDLADVQVEWLSYTHNVVFDVRSREGRFILRLHKPETVKHDYLDGEVAYLHHIRKHSDLIVPNPIVSKTGEAQVDIDGVAGVLFEYIDGAAKTPDTITSDDMQRIGQFIARLHYIPNNIPNSRRPRLDYEGLYGEDSPYNPGEAASIFTDEQTQIIDQTTAKVRHAMDELGQGEDEFGMIHADLLLKNILFHEGQVRALDFEYCGWGYYLYDLTPLLWGLKTHPQYATLEEALWLGYTAVKQLTTRHRELLETFIAGRQVASMRWLASNLDNPTVKATAPSLIGQRTQELAGFLESGRLIRHSITL